MSISRRAFTTSLFVVARPSRQPAHIHSQAAHVAVMRGTLRLGFGRAADRAKAVPVAAGEFFVVRAGEAHFEGSDGPCLIIGTALGGWRTTILG